LIGPQDLTAPLLVVVDPRSNVIPSSSVLPFHEAAGSQVKKVLQYEGDIGVNQQHVGVLVGANGHARIWPAIFDWLQGDAATTDESPGEHEEAGSE
jgi:polyhydroxyalkanoate synthase